MDHKISVLPVFYRNCIVILYRRILIVTDRAAMIITIQASNLLKKNQIFKIPAHVHQANMGNSIHLSDYVE
jgi:hypothetical protein